MTRLYKARSEPVEQILTIPRWGVLLFALAVVAAYSFSLGIGALAEPDEPRYAEIAREMLVRGEWVTPTLNFATYLEKPPLVYWLTALAFQLLGVTDWVARVVPVCCAMLTLGITWAIARRSYGYWTALLGAGVLATSPLFFGLGQTLTLDMPLTVCMTAALACFWLGHQNPSRRRLWYVGLYLATALGVLVKGPIAVVLAGMVIVGFLLVTRNVRTLVALFEPLGILVFLAVVLPWFVLVSIRNPEFAHFFVVEQHLARYLTSSEHQEPLWFFLPIIFGGMIPWSMALVLTPGWHRALRRLRTWRPITWFCVLWAGVVITFFSLTSSKLVTYILPALPPLALLSARALREVLDANAPLAPRLGVFCLLAGTGMLVGGFVANLVDAHWRVPLILPYLYAGGLVMLVTGAVLRRLQSPRRALPVALCGTLALLSVMIAGRDVTTSYAQLGRVIRLNAGPADRIVIYKHYVQGIPFYTGRRVILVGHYGELDFGAQDDDHDDFFWRDDAELLRAWESTTRLFLVINKNDLEALRPRLTRPAIEVAAEGKKVVVINHPLS